jgi:hypothetical protein
VESGHHAQQQKFVAAARKLRILNALRNPNVGFVLTASEFDSITPTGLLARLIAMKRPALATAISKHISLPKSVQLHSRASKAAALVASNSKRQLSDAEIADAAIRIIMKMGKLRQNPNLRPLASIRVDMPRRSCRQQSWATRGC